MDQKSLFIDLARFTRKGWRPQEQPLPYYYHNRRAGAESGIIRILSHGFPVVNSEPYSIFPPTNWGAEQSQNREWGVIRNAFFHVDYILQAWMQSGEEKHLVLAAEIAGDWVHFNIIQNAPNRFKWSDICTGLRAHYFAHLIANVSTLTTVDDEIFAMLLYGGFMHAQALMDPRQQAASNHAIFQAVGLAALSQALSPVADTNKWLTEAQRLLVGVMQLQYGTEGVHLEHSPYYHGWVLERLFQVCDLTWFKSSEDIMRRIDAAKQNFVHFFHPDGSLAELGESSPAKVDWAKSFYPSLEYASSGGTAGTQAEYRDILFKEAGYAVFRDSFDGGLGKNYLIITAGHHSKSHKQDDDFSYEWSAFGQRIVIDAGKHSYDYTDDRRFVASRRAHNVLEIHNDQEFDPARPIGAAQLDYWQSGGAKICRIRRPRNHAGQTQGRIIAVIGDQLLLVVDSVVPDAPGREGELTATQWTHFSPRLQCLSRSSSGWLGRLESSLHVHVSAWSIAQGITENRYFGQREPFIQGWYSPDYGKLEPNFCLGFTLSAANILVATLISVQEESADGPHIENVLWTNEKFHFRYRHDGASKDVICAFA